MTTEKLCLRWNDFERNISESFRKIRDDKEFFDITLACPEKEVQAHKIILSACSPFFKKVLLNHPHSHPLIYLTGVKYQDLEAVLNFMYHGQVNVAQEELNSFLQVAEDLKVKGLSLNTASDKTASKNCLPRLLPKPDTCSPRPRNDIQDMAEVGSFVKSELWDNHPSPLAEGTVNNHGAIVMYNEDAGEAEYGPCQDVAMPESMDNSYEDGSMMIENLKQENIDNESLVASTGEIEDYSESPNQQLLPFNMENGKSFYCDECDKKFTYKKTLQNHKLSYHGAGGMQFPCDLCDHQSNTIALLKRHVNSVHGSVMYPCDQCDYQTPKLANLKVHLQKHEGLRFPCDQCDYQATTPGNLKVHVQKHTGLRYPCNECNFKATEKGGLKKHKQIVHDGIRYPCGQCSYLATQKRYLYKHIEKQHN